MAAGKGIKWVETSLRVCKVPILVCSLKEPARGREGTARFKRQSLFPGSLSVTIGFA